MATILELSEAAEGGDAAARSALFAALYGELHRLARREIRQRGGGLALGATTLLHEAYLDIAGADGLAFPDRARFMGYAARVMRSLVIDHVRSRDTLKRGGAIDFTQIDTQIAEEVGDTAPLIAVGEALDGLARLDAPLAELVDLKFFCGLGFGEIAALRGISERTVQRDWQKAKLLLQQLVLP